MQPGAIRQYPSCTSSSKNYLQVISSTLHLNTYKLDGATQGSMLHLSHRHGNLYIDLSKSKLVMSPALHTPEWYFMQKVMILCISMPATAMLGNNASVDVVLAVLCPLESQALPRVARIFNGTPIGSGTLLKRPEPFYLDK